MIHLLTIWLRERGLHVLAAVAALLTNEPLEDEVPALAGPSADLVGAGLGVAPDEFAVVPRRGPGPQVLLAAERDRWPAASPSPRFVLSNDVDRRRVLG